MHLPRACILHLASQQFNPHRKFRLGLDILQYSQHSLHLIGPIPNQSFGASRTPFSTESKSLAVNQPWNAIYSPLLGGVRPNCIPPTFFPLRAHHDLQDQLRILCTFGQHRTPNHLSCLNTQSN